jgi:hypothetical protein
MNKLNLKHTRAYQFSSKGVTPYLKANVEIEAFFDYMNKMIYPSSIVHFYIENGILFLEFDEDKMHLDKLSIPKDFPLELEEALMKKGIHTVYINMPNKLLMDYRSLRNVLFINRETTYWVNIRDSILDYNNIEYECYRLDLKIKEKDQIILKNFNKINEFNINETSNQTIIQYVNISNMYIYDVMSLLRIENSKMPFIQIHTEIKNLYIKNCKELTKIILISLPLEIYLETSNEISLYTEDSYLGIIDCVHTATKLILKENFLRAKLKNTENAFIKIDYEKNINLYKKRIAKLLTNKIHFATIKIYNFEDFLDILQNCKKPIQVNTLVITDIGSIDKQKIANYTIDKNNIPDTMKFIFYVYEVENTKENQEFLLQEFPKKVGKPLNIQIKNDNYNVKWYELGD